MKIATYEVRKSQKSVRRKNFWTVEFVRRQATDGINAPECFACNVDEPAIAERLNPGATLTLSIDDAC